MLLGVGRKGEHLLTRKTLVETTTVELGKRDAGSLLLGLGVHDLLEAGYALATTTA